MLCWKNEIIKTSIVSLSFEYGSASASTSSHREKTVLFHPIPILWSIRLPNWKARSDSIPPASSIIHSRLPILIKWCLRAKLWGLVLSERIGCWLTITITIVVLGLTKGINVWLLTWLLLLLHKWIWNHACSIRLRVLKWLAILYRKRGCKSLRLLLLTVLERVVWLILQTIEWRRLNLEWRLLLGRLKWIVCRILVIVWVHEGRLERHGLILLHTHCLTSCCCRRSGRFKLERRRICRGWTNIEWRVKRWRSWLLLLLGGTITCCWVTKWALRLNLRLV